MPSFLRFVGQVGDIITSSFPQFAVQGCTNPSLSFIVVYAGDLEFGHTLGEHEHWSSQKFSSH
jgi:hypothetical protein